MASSRARRHRRLLPVLLGVTLLGGGCQFTGVSEAGRERCRRLGAAAGNPLAAALSYVRCLPGSDSSLAAEKAAEAAATARRAALESCRRRKGTITTLIGSLRQAEQELAEARNSPFSPSVAPPQPLDAGKESRYRPEDQRLDRDRYEAALGAWEQQVASSGPSGASSAPSASRPPRHGSTGTPRPSGSSSPICSTVPPASSSTPGPCDR